MHVRYAHNTPKRLGAIEQREEKRAPALMLSPCLPALPSYLPVVPPPGRVSRQPRRLRSGPSHPCEPLRIAGAVTLQPYASRLVIFPVSRGVRCFACIDLPWRVMTPQNRPDPLAPDVVPAPLRPPPQGIFHTIWRTLPPSTSGRRYLGMPTRCIFERVRGLTAARDWWGDLSMQNTWLIGEGVASIMRPGTRKCIRLKCTWLDTPIMSADGGF